MNDPFGTPDQATRFLRLGRPVSSGQRSERRLALPGLQRARINAGLSRRAVAAQIVTHGGPRISETTLHDWERSGGDAPASAVPYIALALGCTVATLRKA